MDDFDAFVQAELEAQSIIRQDEEAVVSYSVTEDLNDWTGEEDNVDIT